MLAKPEHKRIHAFYNGRVQGVGFRFTLERLAIDFGLVGWVRNLPDGRVEFVGEGREKDLQKMLQSIDAEFSGYIRQKDIEWLTATGEFSDFRIEFI